ncbi:hypothetical protein A2215_03615 [Candidatus Berkelbacteria bacterium RIFOXYA2_FULL_43_10]|uniref:t-SNARE coiled-coil homology domain-containing protein n=1 Tax=Candidatus Berkelbacteria bacterium RIFOXYA2_FULL_43_10 TaxID=1797472 RepID=A0A1F5EDA3_9BACT|nr:MAG: hypothetical protein A2215_03615 [Candidatus Berkelbacteria bacterium RIFOXYA2_FULL_43_10]
MEKVERKIEKLEKAMNAGFKRADKSFATIDQKFATIDKSFATIDKSFATIDKSFATIDQKFVGVDKSFAGVHKLIDDLAKSTAFGFEKMQKQMDEHSMEQNEKLQWITNILEKHTGWLKNLDQERIFTYAHVERLEDEINRIKVQLGMTK